MEHKNTHANSSLTCKRVHYAETTETHKDIAPEGETYSPISGISKSSVKYSGDANSEISIDTSILDGEDYDIKTLRRKLEDYEYKVKYLENENKQINDDLLSEKKKTSKLEKKLQFVKDNQEVFMRLKEAYINMKYNEAAGRKMIEIREKGLQTWEGTICSSCLESEELRRQIEIMIQKYSELFVVSPGEMEHLLNTVKYLKDLILRREEAWAFNMDRDHKIQCHIAILEDENVKLKKAIANKDRYEVVPSDILADVKLEQKLLEDRKIEEMQKFVEGLTKDLEKLKKIVIKYEKKFREIKEHHPGKYSSPLNDKEVKIVQQIIIKYNSKIQKKNNGHARSRSPSVGSDRTPQSRRPSSPIRSNRPSSPIRSNKSRDNSVLGTKPPEEPKSTKDQDKEKRAESAIMMMDCLFE